MQIVELLLKAYPEPLGQEVIKSYREIENNFVQKKWKASELDAGHFVESVRRVLELELTGKFTPFSEQLSKFTDQALKSYEQASGNESYRMLIPRALKSIYNIRNKRGAGHVTEVSPNEMDATLILYSAKWVLAELVRLRSTLTIDETQALVSQIVERQIELLWKEGDITRVLHTKLSAKQQVLVLLYDESPQKAVDLQRVIEYKKASAFKGILKNLHGSRLIEYNGDVCFISPRGINEAEKILTEYKKTA